MSVTFVIGRSGSGKTLRCYQRIVDALRADPLGPPIYWIVPRQATFEAERRLTCGSELPGFCRARVLGFATLGKEILGETGGAQAPDITGAGRQMILGHLLRLNASKLVFFKSIERQAGLAAELDATFDELERSGKTAADLAALIDEILQAGALEVETEALLAKLKDVRLLYDAYNEFLGQERHDPHRRLQQVIQAVKKSISLAGSTIYVDGFLEFTNHERQMLGALAAAGATLEVTLVMDPNSPLLKDPQQFPQEMGLFHRTETTYRRLWFTFAHDHVPVNEPVLLRENIRSQPPALLRLEREMFAGPESASDTREQRGMGGPPKSFSSRGAGGPQLQLEAIERVEAADRAAEVDAVARRIQSLLQAGERFRDIAVLVRSLENYRPLIAASFLDHGISYFVDHRRSAAHHPLICFLRAALHAARYDWNHDSVVALMKTGLAGLSLAEADELENYVLLHRVHGRLWESAEPWNWRRDLLRSESDEGASASADDPLRIDSLRRRLRDGLMPLAQLFRPGKALAVKTIAGEVFAMFERFGVRGSLVQWMEQIDAKRITRPVGGPAESKLDMGELPIPLDSARLIEDRDVHEQVWASLCELFEQMVEVLGDERVSPTDFIDIVEAGLDRFDLGITPPTLDQVLVGAADRTRCPPVKTVFVLGLNEGEFPARPTDKTVLTDHERREMHSRRLELDPDGRRQLLDERLLGYVAFTQASQRLVLSRPIGDESGRASAPSAFWHRVDELFPDVVVERVERESIRDATQIATPRQLISGLMIWVRSQADETDEAKASDWPALYQWLVSEGNQHPTIASLRERGWPALNYSNEAKLSRETAALLFPTPLSIDARQLETLAECPFKHFVRYGLKLSGRERADVSGADLGQVYHRILDRLIGAAIKISGSSPADSLAIPADAIHAAAAEIAKAIRGELMLSTARNRYLLQRVERTISEVVAAHNAVMKRSRYRPATAGVSFGRENSALPPLQIKTPAGVELNIHGRIDRIDALPGGNDAILVDYKLGAGTLSLGHVYHGLSLQLLAGLLVLEADGAKIGGRSLKPAAAFFQRLLRSFGDVDHPDEALDPSDERYLLAVKPRGIFDLRALGDLDNGLENGASLVVQVFLKKDGTIGHSGTTDSADSEDFRAILRAVARRLGKLGDDILSGNIAIAPYRLDRKTPCPTCEYRGVCRFETPINRYHPLVSLGREQALDQLRREVRDGK